MNTATKPKAIPLPEGIKISDLKFPSFKGEDKLVSGEDSSFDLWYTERMGWCIPTLRIGTARNRVYADRTYAVTLTGDLVRIGAGPHVRSQQTVYIRESRKDALQKFIDIRHRGAVSANETRDQISTRRARGAMRRALW